MKIKILDFLSINGWTQMMTLSTKKYVLFFFLTFLFHANQTEAVVASSTATPAAVEQNLSKKQKRKIKRLKKLKEKIAKKVEKKDRKNKFGRLGLLALLGGGILFILFDALILALLTAMVLGAIGMLRDEKKLLAILSFSISFGLILIGGILGILAWTGS